MRHEGAAARHSLWAAVVTAGLLAAGPTGAQSMFRGVAEVQYENVNHLVSAEDRESWQKALQIDFSTRIRRMFELSSQLQFSELSYTGRPDRTSTPRGMVRLAHPLFGFSASYRPVTITDERDLTTKQQELMLSGYFQKARLPRVVGSWIRRHVDPQLNFPGSASVTRNVSANYDLGRLNFHAGWGDQASEATQGLSSESLTDHYSVGSSALFTHTSVELSLIASSVCVSATRSTSPSTANSSSSTCRLSLSSSASGVTNPSVSAVSSSSSPGQRYLI